MFAIVATAGSQYKIAKGTVLEVNHINKKEGETFDLDKILLISDKTDTKIGKPYVEGAYATAKVLAHSRGDKVIVFKMRPKERYRRTKGHRQMLTKIEITDIKANGRNFAKQNSPSKH